MPRGRAERMIVADEQGNQTELVRVHAECFVAVEDLHRLREHARIQGENYGEMMGRALRSALDSVLAQIQESTKEREAIQKERIARIEALQRQLEEELRALKALEIPKRPRARRSSPGDPKQDGDAG